MTCRFSSLRALLVLAVLPLVTSCLSGAYNKARIFQPPPVESIDALSPGATDLETALADLGAPMFVVEVGLGMALAWGWQGTKGWNIQISAPGRTVPARFRFSSTDERTMGLVLFFDESWTLTSFKEGHLVDLLPKRPRPRDVEDTLQADPVP